MFSLLSQKLVDGPLMAKWKKPGYERLCSTYVINSKNYKFGTVSICRVSPSRIIPYLKKCYMAAVSLALFFNIYLLRPSAVRSRI